MIKLTRNFTHFTFSKEHAPAAAVHSGETASFETYDCYYNQLLPDGADLTNIDFTKTNAATGPLFVEEALPGDTLAVEILDIRTGSMGVCSVGSSCTWPESPLPRAFRRFSVEDGCVVFDGTRRLPLDPMIGVIGTAPSGEAVSTMTPMDHGGNMDCTRISKGSVLFLPVFVPGALLSLGDLHAVMGDGEVCGCGLEIEGEVLLRVTVLKDSGLPWPAVLKNGHFSVIASAPDVEAAWQLATRRMHEFLTSKEGLSSSDAAIALSLCGDLAICQTVNPYKTVRMELPVGISKAAAALSERFSGT